MGETSQKQEPSSLGTKISSVKSSKPIEKSTDVSVQKKKKRFRGKKGSSKDPAKNLKKIVSNIQRPKETASTNWQAYLTSQGLAPSEIKIKSEPKSQPSTSSVGTSKPSKEKQKRIAQPKNKQTKLINSADNKPTVDFSTDDAYVSELVPKSGRQKELTRCIAVDCEMVGVHDGRESVLARVSLVNQHGVCVYDRFVKPKEKVADFRTKVSGVRPSDLKQGEEFEVVQKEVAAILKGRILIGHAIRNDLKVLMLSHPPKMIRDTSRFKLFKNVTQGRSPALKKLATAILGTTIQSGEHSSIEDARATMQLYNLYQKEWEGHRQLKRDQRRKNSKETAQATTSSENATKLPTNQLLDEFVAF